jgi:hypothetical protein
MRVIEDLINARFDTLPEELKNSPKALLDWALTNTFQQITYMQEHNGSVDYSLLSKENTPRRADEGDLILEIAEQNPHVTGHQIIASAPRC